MDPDATYRLMLEALAEDQLELASDLANSLLQWLRLGGYSPTVTIVGDGQLLELSHEQSRRAVAFAVANEIVLLSSSK